MASSDELGGTFFVYLIYSSSCLSFCLFIPLYHFFKKKTKTKKPSGFLRDLFQRLPDSFPVPWHPGSSGILQNSFKNKDLSFVTRGLIALDRCVCVHINVCCAQYVRHVQINLLHSCRKNNIDFFSPASSPSLSEFSRFRLSCTEGWILLPNLFPLLLR